MTANFAWAGSPGYSGTMGYAPDPTLGVPALSGWLLVVMAVLFGVIAFRVLRSRNVGAPLAVLTAAGITGLGVSAGARLISETEAAVSVYLLNVQGGANVDLIIGDNEYRNATTVPQRILSINPISNCTNTGATALPLPVCAVGLLLTPNPAPGSSCGLNVTCTPPTPPGG